MPRGPDEPLCRVKRLVSIKNGTMWEYWSYENGWVEFYLDGSAIWRPEARDLVAVLKRIACVRDRRVISHVVEPCH